MLLSFCKFWFRGGSSCRSGHSFATDCLFTGYSYNMSCRIHSCRKFYFIISNFIIVKRTIIKIVYSSFRKCGTAVCCKNAFSALSSCALNTGIAIATKTAMIAITIKSSAKVKAFLFLSFFIIGICLSPFALRFTAGLWGLERTQCIFLPFEQSLTLDAQALGFVQR